MGVVGARGLLAGLDVEGGVHGCALVVGVGVVVMGVVIGVAVMCQSLRFINESYPLLWIAF